MIHICTQGYLLFESVNYRLAGKRYLKSIYNNRYRYIFLFANYVAKIFSKTMY